MTTEAELFARRSADVARMGRDYGTTVNRPVIESPGVALYDRAVSEGAKVAIRERYFGEGWESQDEIDRRNAESGTFRVQIGLDVSRSVFERPVPTDFHPETGYCRCGCGVRGRLPAPSPRRMRPFDPVPLDGGGPFLPVDYEGVEVALLRAVFEATQLPADYFVAPDSARSTVLMYESLRERTQMGRMTLTGRGVRFSEPSFVTAPYLPLTRAADDPKDPIR